MILDTLENADAYGGLHPDFADAFRFLNHPGIETLPDGRYEVDNRNVYAMVARTQGRNIDEGLLEGHRQYIDIQYVIAGDESMGWHNRVGLRNATEYDTEKDLEFFEGKPASIFRVPPSSFAIFYPEDAHLPLIGSGAIHKIVVKIAIS